MQEQPELIGRGLGAGGSVGGKMGLPGLDVVFGCAAPAVKVLVKRFGPAAGQIGDDETVISSLAADHDTSGDALYAAPTGGAVKKNSLKRRTLPVLADASKRAIVLVSCAMWGWMPGRR